MLRPWQRIVGCTAAVGLVLLLTGCGIHGTVDVRSGKEVVVDLVFTEAAVDCLGLTKYAGLVVKGTPDSGGTQVCRAQGTLDLQEVKDFGVQVTQTGEYITVDLALAQQYGYMPTNVDITFPGAVVDPGGTTVSGNRVTLEQGMGIATLNPIKIVVRAHPGPDWWVIALVAGLVGGASLTLLGSWLLRRRRRAELASDTAPASPPGTAVTTTEAAQPPVATAAEVVVRVESSRPPDYEAMFATGAAVAPPVTPPAVPTRLSPPVEPPDHRIWAPPEDRGDR